MSERPSLSPIRGDGLLRKIASRLSRVDHLLRVSDRLSFRRSVSESDARTAALHYLAGALESFKVSYEVRGGVEVPSTGPLVVVANHPYGGLEGILLLHWLLSARWDVKVLANEMLSALPPLRSAVISVDVFATGGPAETAQRNARAMRKALRQLEGGGVLLVFPAGEVSHLRSDALPYGPVVCDGPWRLGVAHLLRRTRAAVLPVWVEGRNSAGFQAAGLVHPSLRTALLPRELLNKVGRRVVLCPAGVIPASRWSEEGGPESLMDYLRLRAALASRGATLQTGGSPGAATLPDAVGVAKGLELAAPEDAVVLQSELSALPVEACVVDAGRFRVYRFQGQAAPAVLREVGRLRERTFREVGEGSGKACDLDPYDNYYTHLVLWESVKCEVVGAYRVAAVDVAKATAGRDALYTSSLFHFREPLPTLLSRAVELGRSFVRSEYQRQHLPLLLLWRAIALHLMAQPRRHWLFGPASISARMAPEALSVVVEWLRLHRRHPLLSALVSGKTPTKFPRWSREMRAELRRCTDVEALDRLVADLDPASGGLPPLLRQYLRLGAQFLTVNRDTAFADALDVLVLVDLDIVPEKLLSRLVGAEKLAAFRARRRNEAFMTNVFLAATKLSHNARIT